MTRSNDSEPLILGIETSCDETSAAVVRGEKEVLSSVVATQFEVHAKYGGVVPELASRAHIENLDGVLQEALDQAKITPSQLDAIAVTSRPGLVGSLLIGVTAAKTLALVWGKPLIAVHHVEAHACSAAIELGLDKTPWPALALVVSGGHTSLLLIRDPLDIKCLGFTIDDAAGEAFDKVASILNLGFPGGPAVEKASRNGCPDACNFPRTMLEKDSLDFSFSGLKTAVLYHVHGPGKTSGGLEKMTPQNIADVAASFQAAVVDVLVAKTMLAVEQTGVPRVLVGGGVAANNALRQSLTQSCEKKGVQLQLAPLKFCTDNAAMIAALGARMYKTRRLASLDLEPRAAG